MVGIVHVEFLNASKKFSDVCQRDLIQLLEEAVKHNTLLYLLELPEQLHSEFDEKPLVLMAVSKREEVNIVNSYDVLNLPMQKIFLRR